MDWIPISDAPKDGTDILLTDGKFVYVGCYMKDAIHFECLNCGWCDEQDNRFPWVLFDGGSLNGWKEGSPTHWMPLPDPPQTGER